VETRLVAEDMKRLDDLAKNAGKSRADFARHALLWYLDNQENLTLDSRESEVAKAIRYATDQHIRATRQGADRICKMLARQGVSINTLFELAFNMMPGDEGKDLFDAANETAKRKMRRTVEKDEAELASSMKRVVGAGEEERSDPQA
jgi:predicted DNA-binding protein